MKMQYALPKYCSDITVRFVRQISAKGSYVHSSCYNLNMYAKRCNISTEKETTGSYRIDAIQHNTDTVKMALVLPRPT